MNDENYGTAAKIFDAVEQQHPYSVWATRAQLMAAYADYQGLRYDDAIDALTRFIELHPGNPHVDYAYYMRAICYYEQIADIRRDQRASQQAYEGFNEVIRRFPETAYARDASFKLDLTRDHLAAKEMDIGRYYEREGNYIAAVNRFKTVVDRFQTTSHVPEALERLVECYLGAGAEVRSAEVRRRARLQLSELGLLQAGLRPDDAGRRDHPSGRQGRHHPRLGFPLLLRPTRRCSPVFRSAISS